MLNTFPPGILKLFHNPILRILLIIVSGGLAYSNTFDVPFVLDDYHVIVDNKKLVNFSTFLASDLFPNPRWVALASFALNRSVSDLDLAGFHAVNLIIHLAAGIAVFLLTRTVISTFEEPISRRYAASPLIAALGFVLHPLHTQSVTYVVQRMTSLAALLFMTALLLYALAFTESNNSVRYRRFILYPLALMSCVLAMGTKEISYTLPIVLTLFDFSFLKGRFQERILRLLPFLLCTLALAFFLVGVERGVGVLSHGGGDDVSFPPPHKTYIITQFSVLCTYLRLLILPLGQNLDYDYPFYTSLLHPVAASSFLLVIAFFCCGLYLLKKSFLHNNRLAVLERIGGFAILWFFITISIESGLVPLIDTIFEHRVYLPSVWFFIVFGMLASEAIHRFQSAKFAVILVLSVLFVLAGFSTHRRNHTWRNTVSLWSDVVSKSPDKVRGWASLGIHYVNILDPAKAIPFLEHAVRLNADYYPAHSWLGRALVQKGERDRALEHYLITTRLAPKYPKGWEAAGRIYLEKGQVRDAVNYLKRSMELDPVGFVSQGHLQWALFIEAQQSTGGSEIQR